MNIFLALLLFASSPNPAPDISPAAIGAHMRFLASDLLEGRGTGTRGFAVAAQYVAAQYEALGLETSFQMVPFRRTVALPESSITIGGRTLKLGEGFMSSGDMRHEDATADADVVYVGYGITAPSEKWDDYANVDAKGKIVAFFSGAPKTFSNDVRAHYSSSGVKAENAAAHGAIGILTLRTPLDERRAPWARVVRQYRLGSMNWLEKNGDVHGVPPQIAASATLSRDGMAALFGTGLDPVLAQIDNGTPHSGPLHVRAQMHIVSKHEKAESPNVIGILRGTDLANEYVVYSAHLDHLGISDPVNGDRINNGAFDNASGIAAMLEVVRAFANAPRPRRSILFLATTGEEKGLRGADYFANNPTVTPLVADINIDEILMFHPVHDVVPIGGEHSTLGDAVMRTAREMGVEVSPDPQPEEVVFVRSDQYPFVKTGVPAVYVGAGFKSVDNSVNVSMEAVKWEETIYHTPQDDMSQPMDLSVGAMVAKFDYLLGRDIANANDRPHWKPGDFFGEMFGHSR